MSAVAENTTTGRDSATLTAQVIADDIRGYVDAKTDNMWQKGGEAFDQLKEYLEQRQQCRTSTAMKMICEFQTTHERLLRENEEMSRQIAELKLQIEDSEQRLDHVVKDETAAYNTPRSWDGYDRIVTGITTIRGVPTDAPTPRTTSMLEQ